MERQLDRDDWVLVPAVVCGRPANGMVELEFCDSGYTHLGQRPAHLWVEADSLVPLDDVPAAIVTR